MKRVLKWIGIVLGSLVGLVLVAAAVLHFVGSYRLNNAPAVTLRPVTVPTDAAALARGDHLVTAVSGCRDCHGENLEGTVFLEGELGSYVPAPNLTSGKGGIGGTYTDADWEKAIRHGIGGDNRALVIMPVQYLSHYSDADMGAMIAYLKSVPPVDNDLGKRRMGFPGTALGGVVGYDQFTHINGIDHAQVGTTTITPGVTAVYGEYLTYVGTCRDCHGANLAGVDRTDGPPPGPNLTPGGVVKDWTEADFIQTLRTGVTPDKHQLNPDLMPWKVFTNMTDEELSAIWTYLHSLPALPTNNPAGG